MGLKDPSLMTQVVLESGGSDDVIKMSDGTTIVDKDGNIDAPVTTSDLTTTGNTTLGDASTDTLTVPSTSQFNAPITVGVDDTGYDVKLFGATAGAYMLWDESADELKFAAGASIDLTTEKVMIDFKDGDASSKNPTTDAEAGWINVNIDGTTYYVPYYAAS